MVLRICGEIGEAGRSVQARGGSSLGGKKPDKSSLRWPLGGRDLFWIFELQGFGKFLEKFSLGRTKAVQDTLGLGQGAP